MRARRSRRPPTPPKSALTVLLDRAGVDLAAKGAVRAPAAPWLAAATVLLRTRNSCGWNAQDTPVTLLEPFLAHQGWAWKWDGDELVLELPGWVQSAPVILAIQPGLFDSIENPRPSVLDPCHLSPDQPGCLIGWSAMLPPAKEG
jgi:hypothetical protein